MSNPIKTKCNPNNNIAMEIILQFENKLYILIQTWYVKIHFQFSFILII